MIYCIVVLHNEFTVPGTHDDPREILTAQIDELLRLMVFKDLLRTVHSTSC